MRLRAFVLRSKWIGERLKHVSLFGERIGRFDVVVRLRRGEPPLKFENFSVSELELLNAGERFRVVSSRLISANVPEGMERFYYLNSVSKVYLRYALSGSEKLFELLLRYASIRERFELARTMLILKFTFFEGLFPILRACIRCGSSDLSSFSLEEGGVLCTGCGAGDFSWNSRLTVLSNLLLRRSFNSLRERKFAAGDLRRIFSVFESHLSFRAGRHEREYAYS